MQGFLSLAAAMVLQAVDQLSDEDGAGVEGSNRAAGSEPTPKSKPAAKPKQTTPKKRPAGRGMKRPAASDEPEMKPAEKDDKTPASDKSEPVAKKPAANTRFSVKKNFYKKDRRYGFTVGGSECFYVSRLHYVIMFHPKHSLQ